MGNVGDVHAQFPAVLGLCHRNGIVKILGIRAVNGHNKGVTQIQSPARGDTAGSRALRLVQNLLRK